MRWKRNAALDEAGKAGLQSKTQYAVGAFYVPQKKLFSPAESLDHNSLGYAVH